MPAPSPLVVIFVILAELADLIVYLIKRCVRVCSSRTSVVQSESSTSVTAWSYWAWPTRCARVWLVAHSVTCTVKCSLPLAAFYTRRSSFFFSSGFQTDIFCQCSSFSQHSGDSVKPSGRLSPMVCITHTNMLRGSIAKEGLGQVPL